MFKKILTGTLATLVIGAASVSAYNSATTTINASAQTAEAQEQVTAQETFTLGQSQRAEPQGQAYGQSNEFGLLTQSTGQGQVQAQGGGNGYQGGRNADAGATRGRGQGTDAQNTGMGQVVVHGIVTESELASVTLTTDAGETLTASLDAATLGITLLPSNGVTFGGYWNLDGTLAVRQITLDATGETYAVNGNGGNTGSGYRGGGAGGGGNGNR